MSHLPLFKAQRKCPSLGRLVGRSPVMQQVYQKIECLARTDTTVLIYGETGTGKELAAEAIHKSSSRRAAPLVQVNCSAFCEHLLESELFGHVKGAFTGAIKDRLGRFEAAQGGTLFLDEIGDISPAIQMRLLRVLEQKCLEQVGCNITHPLDIRVITATNKNLAPEVASGRFRADLFYRLNTVTLTLPPLRERRDDIPALVEHFIQLFNQRFSNKIKGITSEAMEELTGRPWPGNVRELKNAIEHAFVYCPGDVIDMNDLGPFEIALPRPLYEEKRKGDRRSPSPFSNPAVIPPPPIQVANPDAETLCKALEQHHWHLERTAAALGMHRTTLWRQMQSLGLSKHN
ncbi:MAG: sigma-54 dependent transcriptional regulator [Methylococcales bacterium]|nr:sigma-54 dependent transcriptional regulator [Methylococcales bacterium]